MERNKRLNPSFTGIRFRGRQVKYHQVKRGQVLTLLLLEYGFGVICDTPEQFVQALKRLNPSFTGIRFRGQGLDIHVMPDVIGLNPSFTGIRFRGVKDGEYSGVVTTTCLNPSFTGIRFRGTVLFQYMKKAPAVLTLLLLEYGFGEKLVSWYKPTLVISLNPSFTGIRFRGSGHHCQATFPWAVLTLLLLEYGFGAARYNALKSAQMVLTLLLLEYGFGV